MGIFEGLEKFGLNMDGMGDLFGEEPENAKPAREEKAPVADEVKEEDFLLDKSVTCVVCDNTFITKALKSSKLRRMEPDQDLRPRYQHIDTLKYDVISCPYCGYTAMSRYFAHLSSLQLRLIRDGVCSKFHATTKEVPATYDYDVAIERYKLSLYNTVVKKGQTSEKAYTCLKMAWLCRGQIEELLQKGAVESSETIKKWRTQENYYYNQAYEGMIKAVASESFPICGMDQNTMDLLLAEMSYRLDKYDMASKLVSRLLLSQTANRNVKDKALELKQAIIAELKSHV